jgi:hypothetical protein
MLQGQSPDPNTHKKAVTFVTAFLCVLPAGFALPLL